MRPEFPESEKLIRTDYIRWNFEQARWPPRFRESEALFAPLTGTAIHGEQSRVPDLAGRGAAGGIPRGVLDPGGADEELARHRRHHRIQRGGRRAGLSAQTPLIAADSPPD